MGSGLGRGGIDVRGGTLYAPDMTLRTALLLLPGGLLGAVPPPGWSQTHAAPFYPDTAKVLQKVVTDARQHGDIPGAVVWVERDGSPVHFASGDRATVPATEAMTEDTVFDVASLTKVLVTAPSVMQLVEAGKLSLSAPIKTYLPEFSGGEREAITLTHLLTHVSGLPPGIPKEPAWTGTKAAISRACSLPLDDAPGTIFRYSDVNFILLGEIVHRVSGETLDAYARKHLFRPLGMDSTTYLPPADWRPRIAPTERDESGRMLRGEVHDPTARRMGGVAGHAGLFTTAADLARFARMMLQEGQLEGNRVLQPETVRLMSRVQTPPTVLARRGLGWDLDSGFSRPRGIARDRSVPKGLFPLGSYGHTGFTGTSLWIDPFSKAFVILLSSRLHPDGKGDARDLYAALGRTAVKQLTNYDPASVQTTVSARLSKDEVPTVWNGIDVLRRTQFAPLKGLRIGLITNHTGQDAERNATIDLLANASGVNLRALFSPEHGIRGQFDQASIGDDKDPKTGLPIHSLYGERKSPTEAQMKDLDALVFDIQDIGCRFYTYISTMRNCLEAAGKAGKKFIILDRVNPLGGLSVEGPSQPKEETFVGCHPLPLRHGMTVGELAILMKSDRHLPTDLTVIKCEGWRRDLWFDATGLPWSNPSPNMRSLTAATLYPGIGLLEFSVSVGRGTDRPFEVVGAPFVDDLRLSHEMNALGLPGIRFLPVRFTPKASIFSGEPCRGVELLVTDRLALRPVDVGIALAATLQRLHPKQFKLKEMNTLLLDDQVLQGIQEGLPWKEIVAGWEKDLAAFRIRREKALLY